MKFLTISLLLLGFAFSASLFRNLPCPATVSDDQSVCFLECSTRQPLAAVENSATGNIICYSDHDNQQRKAFFQSVFKFHLRNIGTPKINQNQVHFSGKSTSLFLVNNYSPSLYLVFRC